jgi:tRNA threonylcarbamoyladenosine biosynthesis protein TsaB
MNHLLAIDTSTTSCSVALFNGDRLISEAVLSEGKTHSRHMLSMVHRILQEGDCHISGIKGLAVTRGPGTFTGLRIGLSTVKGLAAATGVPVVGVSSLAALAFPFRLMERPVVAMIDARRGEVYHAQFRGGSTATVAVVGEVTVCAPEAAAARLPEDAILVGSGAALYRDVFQSQCPQIRFADPSQHIIRAASVGLLAMARLHEKDGDSIDGLIPDYIRKSDAQIQMSGPQQIMTPLSPE